MPVLGKPFVLNDVLYSQFDGIAMESSLSLLLCDMYMHYFEEKLFGLYEFIYRFRCLDNRFVLVSSDVNSSNFLSIINLIDSSIQFTLVVPNDVFFYVML